MSAYTTVRISKERHDLLKRLAGREKVSQQAILEQALDAYRRQAFLEDVNRAYAALSEADRAALADDLSAWDVTSGDALGPITPAGRARPGEARPRGRRR